MSSVKTMFILTAALSILICAGCKKKAVEQPKPVLKTQPVQPKAEQVIPKPQQPERAQPAEPAQKTNVPAHNDTNQVSQSPLPKKKITPPPSAKNMELLPQKKTPGKSETPEASSIDQFASLTNVEEKTEWISDFADEHPDQIADMAKTAVGDANTEVRSAAMDAVIDNEISAPDAAFKAMTDQDEDVREKAVQASEFLDDQASGELLTQAINDQSEEVRASAMQMADNKDNETKLNVYRSAISSQHEDIKDAAVTALVNMSNPQAVDVLIEGLKDQNTDFHNDVLQAIDFLVSHECTGYQDCKNWWDANRGRFDDELNEQAEEAN